MKQLNKNTNTSHTISPQIVYSMTGFLLLTTIIGGIVLSSSSTHADTTASSSVSVTVNSSCTLSASGGGTYSATITPGTYGEITGSTLSTICNDPNGYAIYAVGFGNDSYDTPTNTQMIGTYGNIVTGTATSGSTSNWAMKVSQTTTGAPEIMNSFGSYHVIPEDYTQIAKYTSSTASSAATGASIGTKYQVYVASAQVAGTYTGKVKYTMVHPNDAAAPTKPITLDAIAADSGNTHYMQENINCAGSTTGTKVTLRDNRDNQDYLVAKAKDGQCWMIENLKIGKTLTSGQSLTLTPANSNTTGNFTLSYSDIPSDSKFHAYTVDGVTYQNNSNEWICRTDWDSCYYSWYTATAGAGTTYVSSQGTNVDTSICPAGWALPTQPQFSSLYAQYNSAALMEVDDPTTTMNNNAGKIPGFLLSGNYYTGGATHQSSRGGYWSRTAFSAQNAYYLIMTSSVNPAYNTGKYHGFAVRCLAL